MLLAGHFLKHFGANRVDAAEFSAPQRMLSMWPESARELRNRSSGFALQRNKIGEEDLMLKHVPTGNPKRERREQGSRPHVSRGELVSLNEGTSVISKSEHLKRNHGCGGNMTECKANSACNRPNLLKNASLGCSPDDIVGHCAQVSPTISIAARRGRTPTTRRAISRRPLCS